MTKRKQQDKQWYTKHYKDRTRRTPLKIGMNSGASDGLPVPSPLFYIQTIYDSEGHGNLYANLSKRTKYIMLISISLDWN